MKNRKYLVWIVLTLLFGIIAINLVKNRNTTLRSREAHLTLQDTAKINYLLIRRAKDSIYLSRQTNNTWLFHDKRAANLAYLKFCFRIFSQLKIASLVPTNQWASIRDSIIKGGVEIVLYDDKHVILQQVFFFPDKKYQKTYALKNNAEEPFLVELPGYEGNFSGIFYLPQTQWYQPLIIHYNPTQIREVFIEHTDSPDKSFVLRIFPDRRPILLDYENNPHPYSEEAIKAYLTFLRNIAVERYIDERHLYDSLQHTSPIYRIRIVDKNDSVNQLQCYPIFQQKKADKNFCYVVTGNGLVGILPYYQLDPVVRTIDFFTSFGQ